MRSQTVRLSRMSSRIGLRTRNLNRMSGPLRLHRARSRSPLGLRRMSARTMSATTGLLPRGLTIRRLRARPKSGHSHNRSRVLRSDRKNGRSRSHVLRSVRNLSSGLRNGRNRNRVPRNDLSLNSGLKNDRNRSLVRRNGHSLNSGHKNVLSRGRNNRRSLVSLKSLLKTRTSRRRNNAHTHLR